MESLKEDRSSDPQVPGPGQNKKLFEGVGSLLNAVEVLDDLVLHLNFMDGVVDFPSLGLLVEESGVFVTGLKLERS